MSPRAVTGRRGPRPAPPAPPLPPGVFPFGRHRPRIHPAAFVTPGSYIVGRVTIRRGASVWFGAVLRGDFDAIDIGEDSLIEDNAVVHGRVVVGPRVVVGHGAILHSCRVGAGALIGSRAVVFDGAEVGAGALVAVGSVVYPGTRIPPRTVFRNDAGGNRPSIAPIGTRMKRWSAAGYRRLIAVYRRDGTVAPGTGGT